MTITTLIALGCVGGLLPDVIRLVKNRGNSAVPDYLKAPMFWIGFILLVAIGGFAAWLLGAQDLKQAVAFGYAAPELLSNLGAEPKGAGQKKAPEDVDRTRRAGDIDRTPRTKARREPFNLRRWWRA
jgi:hypothetical protein